MYNKHKNNCAGFTLVEILIALAITGIVSVGIFSVYKNQQDAQLAQKQVVEMQQSFRMAMYVMTKEIRMAGYDPDGTNNAGLISAGDGRSGTPMEFSYMDDDTGTLKTIEYEIYDGYGDGDSDIGRKVDAGSLQPLAENIADLQFTYLDSDGNVTAVLSDIRSVTIRIEATIDSSATNYFQGNNRIVTTTLKFRNLGL